MRSVQEVGELFERGEVFLPEGILSADAMAGASFLKQTKGQNADVIGMSGLLTTIGGGAGEGHRVVGDEALPYGTVVCGAPYMQRCADQIGADAYAEDASDGVKKMDALLGV